MSCRLVRVVQWLLLGLPWLVPSGAQGGQPAVTLQAAYSSISGSQAVLWLARDAGLLDKYGVRAELVFISSGSKLTPALMAGDVAVAQVGGAAVVSATLGGADLVLIASNLNTVPSSLMAAPAIKKVEELRGKAVGVTRFGSNLDMAARLALRRFGLEPDRDVTMLQLGGVQEILAAMRSGAVPAGSLSYPDIAQARKLGFQELVDVSALGIEFPYTALAARRSFVRDREEVAYRFVKGYSEAISVFKTNRELSMRVVGRYSRISDPDVLGQTVDFYAPKMASVPYPTPGGVRFILEQLAPRNPRARSADPKQFLEVRLVNRLEEEGFFRRLPGR